MQGQAVFQEVLLQRALTAQEVMDAASPTRTEATASEWASTDSEEAERVATCLPLTFPLLGFPRTVNRVAVRFVSLQAFSCALLAVVFREQWWAGCLMAALALDYLVRFCFGGMAAPVSCLAALLARPFEQHLVNAAPKQFATSLGGIGAGVTAGLLLSGHYFAGATVAGMLLVPYGLEAFCDFCLGCVIFQGLVHVGIFGAKDSCNSCTQLPNTPKAKSEKSDDDSDETESTTASVV